MLDAYQGWRYFQRVDIEDGTVRRYRVQFFRQSGDWYDEIRYDSHDRKGGRRVLAPHFHIKLRSAFKLNIDAAVDEVKEIIDNQLQTLEFVVKR
jgi:hypothetical protein